MTRTNHSAPVLHCLTVPGSFIFIQAKRYRALLVTDSDDLCRAFFGAFAASGTFLIVNVCDVIFYGDRTDLTLLFTELAGKASGRADLFDCGSSVVAGTAHCVGGRVGNQLDQVSRTGGHALTAGSALGAIHLCNAVIDGDGAEPAGCCACPESDTAIITGPRREAAADGRSTVMDSDVMAACSRIFAVAGAFDEGGYLLYVLHFEPEQAADLFSNQSAADRAAVYRRFLVNDCGSQCITAGVTAAAAVIPRQTFTDRDLFFIYFYFKFFIDCDQQDADQKSDNRHCNGGYDD